LPETLKGWQSVNAGLIGADGRPNWSRTPEALAWVAPIVYESQESDMAVGLPWQLSERSIELSPCDASAR